MVRVSCHSVTIVVPVLAVAGAQGEGCRCSEQLTSKQASPPGWTVAAHCYGGLRTDQASTKVAQAALMYGAHKVFLIACRRWLICRYMLWQPHPSSAGIGASAGLDTCHTCSMCNWAGCTHHWRVSREASLTSQGSFGQIGCCAWALPCCPEMHVPLIRSNVQ